MVACKNLVTLGKIQQTKTLERLISEAEQFFAAGAHMLMVESEGITEGIENPQNWRKDVILALIEKIRI